MASYECVLFRRYGQMVQPEVLFLKRNSFLLYVLQVRGNKNFEMLDFRSCIDERKLLSLKFRN